MKKHQNKIDFLLYLNNSINSFSEAVKILFGFDQRTYFDISQQATISQNNLPIVYANIRV